jgi:hypothetical protein
MSVKQNLRAAKQLIIDKGWAQGVYQNEEGCFCMVGAVRVAMGITAYDAQEGPMEPPEIRAIVRGLRGMGKPIDWSGDIIDWNDAPGRTEREVLELFDEAIRIADE